MHSAWILRFVELNLNLPHEHIPSDWSGMKLFDEEEDDEGVDEEADALGNTTNDRGSSSSSFGSVLIVEFGSCNQIIKNP